MSTAVSSRVSRPTSQTKERSSSTPTDGQHELTVGDVSHVRAV